MDLDPVPQKTNAKTQHCTPYNQQNGTDTPEVIIVLDPHPFSVDPESSLKSTSGPGSSK
jgi:hypothetical protein